MFLCEKTVWSALRAMNRLRRRFDYVQRVRYRSNVFVPQKIINLALERLNSKNPGMMKSAARSWITMS